MGITQDGIEGEQKLFAYLKAKNLKFFQADAIGLDKENYSLYEVKHQERYLPPPFEGHGLPKWQIEARMSFYKTTGIRCKFVVFEKGTTNVFEQWLDVLESKEHFDTQGLKPRRIYPITSFEQWVFNIKNV
jgi:hypothetical protein